VRSGGLLVVSHTRPRSLRASLETVRHLGAFRPSAEWREVVANLFVTGAWKGNRHHPISSAAVDRWAVSAHYQKIASLDLYNLRIFGRDLDADPLGRGLIAAALARRLAWTHIGLYRHLPRKGGHG